MAKPTQVIRNTLNPIKETPMADILTSDDGDMNDGFLFEYDSDLGDAIQPQCLPNGYKVEATVENVRLVESEQTGKPQLIFVHIISPDHYPADYPVEHYPDGIRIIYYSPEISNTVPGRFNAKKIAAAYQVPLGKKLRTQDFMNKRVKLTINIRQKDGVDMMSVKGIPEPVNDKL